MADLTRKSMEDIQNLEHQEEVQYVLGNPPAWIIKWGISFIGIIVLLCLAIGWLIEYPDIVAGKVKLFRINPAASIVVKGDTQVKEILVNDGQFVEEGSILAVLDRLGNLEEIQELESLLAQFQDPTTFLKEQPIKQLPDFYGIGTLKTPYYHFKESCVAFQKWMKQNPASLQAAVIEQQKSSLNQNIEHLHNEQRAIEESFQLVQKDYERQQKLYENKAVSERTLEEARKLYLKQNQERERIQLSIARQEEQALQLDLAHLDIRASEWQLYNDYYQQAKKNCYELQMALQVWKDEHLLIAPIAGHVSMPQIWGKQVYFAESSIIMTIIPENDQDPIAGMIELPVRGSGRVLPGMEVRIHLDNYPSQEFGAVVGSIESISVNSMKKEDGTAFYLARVSLAHQLRTSADREIVFLQEMEGQASVITESRSVLERIFDKVFGAVSRV